MDQNTNIVPPVSDDQKLSILPVEILIPGIKPDLETPNMSPEAREDNNDSGFTRTGHAFDNTYLDKMLGFTKDKFNQEFFTKFVKGVRAKLQGQTIVDLGAGSTNLGYCTSLLFGAAKYVAVEKFGKITKDLISELTKISFKNGEIPLDKSTLYDGRKILKEQNIIKIDKLIPVSVAQDKMLHFLKRLPDNSVSILTSGINYALIDNTEYREAIAREIERVLSPTGVYISRSSDINTKNLSAIPNLTEEELEIKVFAKNK